MPRVTGSGRLRVGDLADQFGPHPVCAAGFVDGNALPGRRADGRQRIEAFLQVGACGLAEAGADPAAVAALPADDDSLNLLQLLDFDPRGAARSGQVERVGTLGDDAFLARVTGELGYLIQGALRPGL